MKKDKLPRITLKRGVIDKRDSIQLFFKYNDKLISCVRNMSKFEWDGSIRCWHGPFSSASIELIQKSFIDIATIAMGESIYILPEIKKPRPKRQLSDNSLEVLQSFIKYLKGKRYSKSTIGTYSNFIGDFLEYIKNKPLDELTNRDVELFIEDVFVPRKYSISTQRQFISSMKLFKDFYPECKIEELELVRPRKSKILPTVLSQDEILEILRCTKNLKHRAMLALLYSCGLRIGELIDLELSHIDIARLQLVVRRGKGRKDRYVNMAESFIPLLHNYINTYKPQKYFVEGKLSVKYSDGSIRKFLKRSCVSAGIKKPVTPHTLRHSYATHLLENGTDIRLIQTLLGHARPETTMIYTHVSTSSLAKIKNPLDMAVKRHMDANGPDDVLRLKPNKDY